jgi:transposase
MGIKRYELNEVQWARIEPLLPGKASDPGRTGSDNRLFVNGCLWDLRSGAHWCDLLERYGRWKTVHRRFSRWCHAGVWERVFDTLAADRDNSYLMIDSTIVRAHQQAAAGKGGQGPGVGAFPRRTDHQDPHARGYVRSPRAPSHHARPSQRHHRRAGPSRRSAAAGHTRRQSL